MGLTVNQTEQILQPIAQYYANFESARIEQARKDLIEVNRRWANDPLVKPLVDLFEQTTGMNWEDGYRSPGDQTIMVMQSQWPLFVAGVINTPAYQAYLNAGYTGPIKHKSFHETAEYNLLTVALRTTKLDWGRLSAPFSSFVVSASIATNSEEILKACNEFLMELR